MPDLNSRTRRSRAALDDVARFWLEDMGVDGFRLDAARHLIEDGATSSRTRRRPSTGCRASGRASRPATRTPWSSARSGTRRRSRRATCGEGALDLTFDFGLAGAILGGVRLGDAGSLAISPGGGRRGLPGRRLRRVPDQPRPGPDDRRQLGRDAASGRPAATLLLTDPGVPFIYYGEELGLRGRKPDERIRTPMPWNGDGARLRVHDRRAVGGHGRRASTTANVAAQTDDPARCCRHYRDLIALRDDPSGRSASRRARSRLRRSSRQPAASTPSCVTTPAPTTSRRRGQPGRRAGRRTSTPRRSRPAPLCGDPPAADAALRQDRATLDRRRGTAPSTARRRGFDAWADRPARVARESLRSCASEPASTAGRRALALALDAADGEAADDVLLQRRSTRSRPAARTGSRRR